MEWKENTDFSNKIFAQKLLKIFFKSDVTFKNCPFSWILELIVRFGVEKVSVKYYYYSVTLKTKSNNISIIPGFGSRSCSQQVQWGPFYKVFSKKRPKKFVCWNVSVAENFVKMIATSISATSVKMVIWNISTTMYYLIITHYTYLLTYLIKI